MSVLRSLVMIGSVLVGAAAMPALAQEGCPPDVGAALAAACPCAADSGNAAWRNHGKYVSCVVRFRNDLRRRGCLDAHANGQIARCAARSTCGKPDTVLCCVYDTSGTCSDTAPGDTVPGGDCSNDPSKACDTATDCVTVRGPKVTKADLCAARGGTSIGAGSVCAGCPLPPPAP
jgi:hypothetical protein